MMIFPYRPNTGLLDRGMQTFLRAGLVVAWIAALSRIGVTAGYSEEAPETKSAQYRKLDSAFSRRISEFDEMYGMFEKHLLTAVRYEKETTDGGVSRTEQAWINELDQILEVSVERTSPAGSELTEYFYNSDRVILMQRHQERVLENGISDVQAEKFFYWEKDLDPITGLPRISNRIRRVTMSTCDERQNGSNDAPLGLPADQPLAIGKPGAQAWAIVEKLISAGPPKYDPMADPEAQKYRLIMDSVSPNGRYALAFGPKQEKIDWEEHRDAKRGGYVINAETDAKKLLRNYVVDLKTHKILGETGCRYSRTRSQDNNPLTDDPSTQENHECYTVWSENGDTFVQTVLEDKGKERYYDCRVGRMADGSVLSTLDLGGPAAKLAKSIATRKGWKLTKDNGNFEVELGGYKKVSIVGDEINLTMVAGGEWGGDDIEEYFTVKVAKDVLSLQPSTFSKEVRVERGTPFYAEPALNADEQEYVDKKRALLERRLKLLLEQQREETLKTSKEAAPK